MMLNKIDATQCVMNKW